MFLVLGRYARISDAHPSSSKRRTIQLSLFHIGRCDAPTLEADSFGTLGLLRDYRHSIFSKNLDEFRDIFLVETPHLVLLAFQVFIV